MGKTNLGKVLIAPRGTWDASTAYERLDVVNNNGASWIAKRENTGVTPADGDDWTNLLDITKDGVIDALGYTPDNDEPVKLIADIEVTEEGITLIKQEVSLKKQVVVLADIGTTATSTYTAVTAKVRHSGYSENISRTNYARYIAFCLFLKNGVVYKFARSGARDAEAAQSLSSTRYDELLYGIERGRATGIHTVQIENSKGFAIGTKVKIYGV